MLLREGLRSLLERFEFTVVASVGDAEALVSAVDQHSLDLVITDVRMPPGFRDEGLRAAVQLRTTRPELPIVVLSHYVETRYAEALLDFHDGRALGYLLKERVAEIEDFVASLRRVAAGGTVVDPTVIKQLVQRQRDPLDRLTQRQRDVLVLMAEGHSNARIARDLTVSEAAVGKHIGSIMAKLDLAYADVDVNRRVKAVLAFLRAG
ncbi:DNA-binding NarL/FixJ family response regulator [Actinoalloteichus hoggarensis]|uniref:Transcriptional regulatory protein DegU n=1 Tax=Actinoalloteichus hoggarensis TaxID=1470176 RepID=A0A221VYU5_9PSEU|nr:response regulator transcription factor [Actinoalloteichus hoggarensis]ASO18677.1 Transcriptional regulatory protein DegU [Actinoalloteichus hoggarensis]MBB5919908.1 DNA-binding NarL/FixJ family response regulator [Actinoalloteichus hoggarensis]